MATACPASTVKLTESKMSIGPDESETLWLSCLTSIVWVLLMIVWRFIALVLCSVQFATVAAQDSTIAPPTPLANANLPVILVVGDSLSAEYGLERDSGWVKLLQQQLDQEGYQYRVQNASISGDTSSGGLSRLPIALNQHQPALVIIELGGNDALRGLALSMTENNLDSMVQLSLDSKAQVLLLGMQIPPNYGPKYAEQFRQLFVNLAAKHSVGLVPFFLAEIATDRQWFQADGIHPNEAAQAALANTVWVELKPLLSLTTKH